MQGYGRGDEASENFFKTHLFAEFFQKSPDFPFFRRALVLIDYICFKDQHNSYEQRLLSQRIFGP